MIKNCAALTIAGSDSGGGAGIQADLKTFSAMGVYGTSVITAVTAQNHSGVTAIQPVDPEVVQKQLIAVLEGFPVKAVKTGMLFSAEIIEVIAKTLSDYCQVPVIIDPVFTATTGSKLIQYEDIEQLKEKLFPLAALVTPNIPEAEILTGKRLKTRRNMEQAAQMFFERFHVPVLIKGGHLPDKAVDIFYDCEGIKRFESDVIKEVNNHGSGCALSSAIAAAMARGESLGEALAAAKAYITLALRDFLQLSPDLCVINHFPQTSNY